MKKQIEQIRQDLIQKLKAELGDKYEKVEFAMTAPVEFNPRMRTSAGRARIKHNIIELNPDILGRHPEHLEQTVAHEFAHLVAYALFGPRLGGGHGRGWKRTMGMMGHPADRTHNLSVDEKKVRKHKVKAMAKCGCRMFEIKTKRFNNMQNGAVYRCRCCGQKLELMVGGAE